MDDKLEGNQKALFTAKRELARIDEEALKAQATLMRLKDALSHAQKRLSETQRQCNLLDANEHLVVEIMRLPRIQATIEQQVRHILQSTGQAYPRAGREGT